MQADPKPGFSNASRAQEWAADASAHLLPAPHTAMEKAAMEAAIQPNVRRTKPIIGRMLVGTAMIAIAIGLPDTTVRAVSAQFIEFSAPNSERNIERGLPPPAARATAPIYVTAKAAEEIAPAALSNSSRARFLDCLLYTSPSPRDLSTSRMPSSA